MIERSWGEYFRSHNVLGPGEEKLLHVFEVSLCGSPLPAPWSMCFDREKDAFFFTNSTTGESSWTHPLHHLFVELASVGRKVADLPPGSAPEYLAGLKRRWDNEARTEIAKWHSAIDSRNGSKVEYFYHEETKAVMWEKPADAILPGFYIKKEFLKNLSLNFDQTAVTAHPFFDLAQLSPKQMRGSSSMPTLTGQAGQAGQGQVHVDEDVMAQYLLTHGVVSPSDQRLLAAFQGALKGAPLPAPWISWYDKSKKTLFFKNTTTKETQLAHPLHDLLCDLATVGRRVLDLPHAVRAEHLAAVDTAWENAARSEILKWQTANEDGREYFYNTETSEIMWERPVGAVLPAFYLKKQFLKSLGSYHQETKQLEPKPSKEEPGLLPRLLVRRDTASTVPSTANTVTSQSSQSEDGRQFSRTRRASRKLSDVAHLDDNWEYYLVAQGIVILPGEENLLKLFQSVLKRAPLPAPWKMWHDKISKRFVFMKKTTGATSWQHPLNHVLNELAGIARHHFTLPESRQEAHISTWGNSWDAQTDVELAKWNPATDEEDSEYFFNSETNETMWERPEDVMLPELFLRRQFLAKLSSIRSIAKEVAVAKEEVEVLPSVSRRGSLSSLRPGSPKGFNLPGKSLRGLPLKPVQLPPPRDVQEPAEEEEAVLSNSQKVISNTFHLW